MRDCLLPPAKPGAARRCACFGKSRANRSHRYTPKMKQRTRIAESRPSELRVACRNCVLCSHADFHVRRVFAGGPGELSCHCCVVVYPRHTVFTLHSARRSNPHHPSQPGYLALASPGCPLYHCRPHLQPTRGPNEAISSSFMRKAKRGDAAAAR